MVIFVQGNTNFLNWFQFVSFFFFSSTSASCWFVLVLVSLVSRTVCSEIWKLLLCFLDIEMFVIPFVSTSPTIISQFFHVLCR